MAPAPLRQRAAAAAPQSRSARARGTRRLDLRPSLFVVGDASFAAEVAQAAASRFGVGCHVPELEDALEDVNEATLALVFTVDPSRRGEASRVESQLRLVAERELTASLHRFAVLSDAAQPSLARRLYACSASAVFAWPRERDVFPDLLIELLGTLPRSPRSDDDDGALGKAVRARLKLMLEPGDVVRAASKSGILVLSGATHSVWRKEAIEQEVEEVPGVRHVVSHTLRVERAEQSDRQIARSVRRLIGLVRRDERHEAAIDVTVNDGVVRLEGEVASGAEARRLSWLAANLPGVSQVDNEARVLREAPARRGLVRRLTRRIHDRFPTARVDLRQHDGAVELEGEVDLLAHRRRIRELCEEPRGVERVVDKLQVRRDAPAPS